MGFSLEGMPAQDGRTAVVTGANAGLGFETTRMLAQRGAQVVMACRSEERAAAAKGQLAAAVPGARLEVMVLDLGSLASVREFARRFRERYERLDLLVNNAGVMLVPRGRTGDGFETTLGTNHLGHFLLTSLLLDLLPDQPQSRVVTVSSATHKAGKINFADLQSDRSYSRAGAYAQSKLANLMFALELHRRLERSGRELLSVAAHPGIAASTSLIRQRWLRNVWRYAGAVVSNSTHESAKSTIMAALDPAVTGGQYYGPQGFLELKGGPGTVEPSRNAQDPDQARRLWELSEELTGASFPL